MDRLKPSLHIKGTLRGGMPVPDDIRQQLQQGVPLARFQGPAETYQGLV